MGWERRDRARFFYVSQWLRGRVVKQYVGPAHDPLARIIATVKQLQRAEIQAAAAKLRAEQTAYQQADDLVGELHRQGEILATAGLVARGWYRHSQGPWQRRKRKSKMRSTEQSGGAAGASGENGFVELVSRANRGDAEALAEVRAILDRNPGVWQEIADLAAHTQAALIRLIATGNQVLAESLPKKLEAMKAELQGESPTPLEKILVERIVAGWLQVEFAEAASIEHARDAGASYWQKRLDQAQHRYLAAVTSLATVRKLMPAEAAAEPA
jgi:hypothetical protein